MSTSNSVGVTTLSVARLIEKARLRCLIPPEKLTQSALTSALENLFLIVANIANRGINIWCQESVYLALSAGKFQYRLPAGTLEILNAAYSTPTLVGQDTKVVGSGATKNTVSWTLDSQSVIVVGVKFSTTPDSLTLSGSNDGGVTHTDFSLNVAPIIVGEWKYYDLGQVVTYSSFALSAGTAGLIADAKLVSNIISIPLTQMNHDEYFSLPNKEFQSSYVTSYFYERKMQPLLSVWPVPSADDKLIQIYRHRQVQDVLSMTEQLEVPSHLLDSIIWNLAVSLAFECPEVSKDTRDAVVAMAQLSTTNADGGSSDGSPTFITPAIGCYTK